jgi:hypothetical protein
MLQPDQDSNQEFQDLSLRAVCHRHLLERDGLEFINQADTLDELAPLHQHGILGQRFRMILVHDNSPSSVAMNLPDQGSVVKSPVFLQKSNLLAADCTKDTLELRLNVSSPCPEAPSGFSSKSGSVRGLILYMLFA